MNIEALYTVNDNRNADWWCWQCAFEAMYANYSYWGECLNDCYYSYCNI